VDLRFFLTLWLLAPSAWGGTILAHSKTGWTSLARLEGNLTAPVCVEANNGDHIACGEIRYKWGEKVIITWARKAAGKPVPVGAYVGLGEDEETILAETPISLSPGDLEAEAAGMLHAITTRKSLPMIPVH